MAIRFCCSFLLAFSCSVSFAAVDDSNPEKSKAADQHTVVYLHTEWNPFFKESEEIRKGKDDPDSMERLTRELARQAMMVTLTHEFGLPVRDATLYETLPENANVIHLAPLTRRDYRGRWKVKLYRLQPDDDGQFPDELPHQIWADKADWEHTFKYRSLFFTIYKSGAEVLEKASRYEFLDALKAAGIVSRKSKPTTEPVSMEQIADWSDRLMQVDFIALFSVLREVHQAVAKQGESPELLGLLSRGYAQLGLMTAHSMNSSHEVFAARSMIYAHRMAAQTNQSEVSRWHYAWAFGLVGLQRTAIANLDSVEGDKKKLGDVPGSDAPHWSDLVEPLLQWDRRALLKIAETDEHLRPWALRLYFQLVDDYRYENEVQEAYSEVVSEISSAWGIYAGLFRYHSLQAMRSAAPAAMLAWQRAVPASLTKIEELPPGVRKVVNARSSGGLLSSLKPKAPADSVALISRDVARALRRASKEDTVPGMSWSTLAFLLEEEQFLQAARYMEMSLNATESSHGPTVDRLAPWVQGHRYAPYVESFRYYNRDGNNAEKYKETLRKIDQLPDPRQNMYYLVTRVRRAWEPDREWTWAPIWLDFTPRGHLEYLLHWGNEWNPSNKSLGTDRGNLLRACLPNAIIGTRMNVQAADNPPVKKLKSWERVLKDDAVGLAALARLYQAADNTDEAIRLYKDSLECNRLYNPTARLADLYFSQNNFDGWESTWLEFMRSSDSAMSQSSAARKIAYGYHQRGLWRQAKPYAETAAEVWSATGLSTASDITEQLGEWDESERWIKAESTAYPSHSGHMWYFWCRRTGRGNLDSARSIAERYFNATVTNQTRDTNVGRGAYFLMEGDLERSLQNYDKALDFYTSLSCTCMVARLSRKLGDQQRVSEVIDRFRQYVKGLEEPTPIDLMGMELMNLIESDSITPQLIEKLSSYFEQIEPVNACMTSYLIGQELLDRDKPDLAKKHFRQAMNCYARETYYTTLAGHQLSQLDGTSRPDDDERTAEDIWLAPSHLRTAGTKTEKK